MKRETDGPMTCRMTTRFKRAVQERSVRTTTGPAVTFKSDQPPSPLLEPEDFRKSEIYAQ